MKHLIHSVFLALVGLVLAASAGAQARPFAGPDLQKTYDRLLAQIEKIPLYDNHAHPGFGDDSDVDAMAAPPNETDFLRTRADNHEFVIAASAPAPRPMTQTSSDPFRFTAEIIWPSTTDCQRTVGWSG